MGKSKWLTGKEITEYYSIENFDLLNLVRKGLQPHDPEFGIPVPALHVSRAKSSLEESKFDLKVLEFELARLEKTGGKELDQPMGRPGDYYQDLLHPQKSYDQQKTSLEVKIQETKVRIDTAEKEFSEIKDDSWGDYNPSSDMERREVTEDLLGYLYMKKDKEPDFFDQTYEKIMGKAVERIKSKQVSPEKVDTGTHGPEPSHIATVKEETTRQDSNSNTGAMENGIPVLSFYKVGDYWKIGKFKNETTLEHRKGYEFVHFLIQHERQNFDAATVYHLGKTPTEHHKVDVGHVPNGLNLSSMCDSEFADMTEKEGSPVPSADPIIDEKTVKLVEKNIQELKENLRGELDQLKCLEIKEKIEKQEKYLRDAKRGHSTFDSGTNKARLNVYKSIKRVLDILACAAKEYPSLTPVTQALRLDGPGRTIMTGHQLCYKPDPSNPVKWRLDPH